MISILVTYIHFCLYSLIFVFWGLACFIKRDSLQLYQFIVETRISFFMAEWYYIVCVCYSFVMQSCLVYAHLNEFYLSYYELDNINMGVQVSFTFWFHFCGCIIRNEVARSYGRLVFKFQRSLHTVFHNDNISIVNVLHFFQQYVKVSFSHFHVIICYFFSFDSYSNYGKVISHYVFK